MFFHHVSAVTFCRLWCSLSKGLSISLELLFFFAFDLSQAEGYGFRVPSGPLSNKHQRRKLNRASASFFR